jgi:uncharacterized protein (DUF849 family)
MSPYLPITPAEIANEAIVAHQAGAAVVHLHARDPKTGQASFSVDLFQEIAERIRAESDVVLNISTGGSAAVSDRIAPAKALKPEMASLNMGSLSPYGRRDVLDRFKNWNHDWEVKQFQDAATRTYVNDEQTITTILEELSDLDICFECECYDLSHLYNVAYFVEKGLLKHPFRLQLIFGFSGGVGIGLDNLVHARRVMADLFGADVPWSVLAPGKEQFRFCTFGALMGGGVRVGLEDSLYISKGELARSNADQVSKMKNILSLLSINLMTADDLQTEISKGKTNV